MSPHESCIHFRLLQNFYKKNFRVYGFELKVYIKKKSLTFGE